MKNQLLNSQWLWCVLFFMSCYDISKQDESEKKMPVEKKIAVVELFTSEGCSSCPPADALLRTIQAEDNDIYVLSYHVDYWDRLGWKDPFSQAAFSERQKEYAQQFNLESVYTPQVVVNGMTAFVGSDEQKLRSTLNEKIGVRHLDTDVKRHSASAVSISYKSSLEKNAVLYIALVQSHASTEVKKGENNGRLLRHVNVVRKLFVEDIKTDATPIEMIIPADLQSETLKVVLFVQQKNDKRIIAAATADIPLL